MDLATIYIGDRLGLYEALAAAPGSTPAELARSTGTDERMVREWLAHPHPGAPPGTDEPMLPEGLEHHTVGSLLDVDDPAAEPEERRYRLPEGAEEVFLDPESLAFATPMAQYGVGLVRPIDELIDAFRKDGGLPSDRYGDDVREAQAAINRPQFVHLLATEWFPAMPDVHARLQGDASARIADVACGGGWSSIVMAKAYPNAHVDGFDLDSPSIDMARRNAEEAGVS